MASNRYQYTTSPRKVEPDYNNKTKKKKRNKKKLTVVENVKRQDVRVSEEERKQQKRITIFIVMIFAVLLTISYRNSQINERFSEIQNLKQELGSLEKENEQLEVNIENSLNLNYIEQLAKEKLGMQKITNKNTVYINLPKKDYTESASEKVIIDEKNWFEKLIDNVKKLININ